jgi:hypothetical protein
MEQLPECIEFERETVLNIRGMRIIVRSYFDDTQEGLKEKVAQLLKNDIAQLQNQSEHVIIAA